MANAGKRQDKSGKTTEQMQKNGTQAATIPGVKKASDGQDVRSRPTAATSPPALFAYGSKVIIRSTFRNATGRANKGLQRI